MVGTVILLDVDDTLLDNDGFGADLHAHVRVVLGPELHDRYWALYDELRQARGYADYFEPLVRIRAELQDGHGLSTVADFILDYPFEGRLYPSALDVIRHLGTFGPTVLLTDGDLTLQPRKIRRSGLWDAVSGRMLVTVHKERELPAMERHYPAARYVMVGDKPKVLAGMKRGLADRLTTVFVRQGHYATEAAGQVIEPRPDVAVDSIAALLEWKAAPRHAVREDSP